MATHDDQPAVGDMLSALLAGAPTFVHDSLRAARERRAEGGERAREREPERTQETPEEAAERRERARAHRLAQWDARRPLMYRQAALSDLHPEHQHQGTIRKWLASQHRTLVMHSQRAGTGKTHAAYAVGNVAVGNGLWTVAYTAADLNAALRPDGEPGAWEAAAGCDVLVLDDLGREHDSGWTQEQLHRLLDTRAREHRRTVVTTNLTGQALMERYGDPVVDRLVDDAVIVEFTGESRRRVAPW